MSEFYTDMKAPIEELKKALPAGSDVLSLTWIPKEGVLRMAWSNEKLRAPFTHGNAWPFSALTKGKGRLPEGVMDLREKPEAAQQRGPANEEGLAA